MCLSRSKKLAKKMCFNISNLQSSCSSGCSSQIDNDRSRMQKRHIGRASRPTPLTNQDLPHGDIPPTPPMAFQNERRFIGKASSLTPRTNQDLPSSGLLALPMACQGGRRSTGTSCCYDNSVGLL